MKKLNEILKDILDKYCEEEGEKLLKESEKIEPHNFSDEFENKMNKLSESLKNKK